MTQAQTLERQGQLPQAEAAYRQIVADDPANHAAWHALGLLIFNTGNLPLAVQCLEAAVAVNGKVALYHRNLGEMYRRLGQLDKSAQAGRHATKLPPADLDAHYNLGLAYWSNGQREAAGTPLAALQAINQRDPGVAVLARKMQSMAPS